MEAPKSASGVFCRGFPGATWELHITYPSVTLRKFLGTSWGLIFDIDQMVHAVENY
jgi:hypothetical protein